MNYGKSGKKVLAHKTSQNSVMFFYPFALILQAMKRRKSPFIIAFLAQLILFSVCGQSQEVISAESFLKESLEKRKLETDSSKLLALYNSIAYLYSLENNWEMATLYLDSGYAYSFEMQDTLRMIEALALKRTNSAYQGKMDLALNQSEQVIGLSSLSNDTSLRVSITIEHAKLLDAIGMTHAAIDSLQSASAIVSEGQHPKIVARVHYLNAKLFESIGKRDEMYSNINQCIELEEKYTKSRALVAAWTKKAQFLVDDQKMADANTILLKAEQHALTHGFEKRLVSIFALQGKVKSLEGKHEEAILKYQEMESKMHIKGLEGSVPQFYTDMSKAYLEAKQYKLALSKALLAQKHNEELNLLKSEKEINLLLSQIYTHYGDFEKAMKHRLVFESARDSLETISQMKLAKNLEARFRNEEQKRTILQKDKDLVVKENELISSTNRFRVLLLSFGALLLVAALSIFGFRQHIKNQKQQAKIELNKALLESTEEERERIARELHDSTGSMLTGIKLGLERVAEETNAKDLKESLTLHISQVQDVSQEVRRISHAMAPSAIDRLSFENLLNDLLNTFKAIGSVNIEQSYSGDLEKLNKTEKLMLYRILQECLNNSFKHSEADEIHVSISVEEHSAELLYQDNGNGYDKADSSDGIGLSGINRRIKYLNGNQTLETDLGEGMLLIASFPLMRT